jgi:hypothetical protein
MDSAGLRVKRQTILAGSEGGREELVITSSISSTHEHTIFLLVR